MPNVVMSNLTYPVIHEVEFGDKNDPVTTIIDSSINTKILTKIEELFPLQRNGRNGSEVKYPPNWEVCIISKIHPPLSTVVGNFTNQPHINIAFRPYTTKNSDYPDYPDYTLRIGSLPFGKSILSSSSRHLTKDFFLCELKVPCRVYLSTFDPSTMKNVISTTFGSFMITVAEQVDNNYDVKVHTTSIAKELASYYGKLLDELTPIAYIQYDLYSNEPYYLTLSRSSSSDQTSIPANPA